MLVRAQLNARISVNAVLLKTFKVGRKLLLLQFNISNAVKACIPVKSVIPFEETFNVVTLIISAVKTWPSRVPTESIVNSIKACSKFGSGIQVYPAGGEPGHWAKIKELKEIKRAQ